LTRKYTPFPATRCRAWRRCGRGSRDQNERPPRLKDSAPRTQQGIRELQTSATTPPITTLAALAHTMPPPGRSMPAQRVTRAKIAAQASRCAALQGVFWKGERGCGALQREERGVSKRCFVTPEKSDILDRVSHFYVPRCGRARCASATMGGAGKLLRQLSGKPLNFCEKKRAQLGRKTGTSEGLFAIPSCRKCQQIVVFRPARESRLLSCR
jgi:hypothetical protein